MAEVVALDLQGGPGFVTALRAAWDRGDAVLPLDPTGRSGRSTAGAPARPVTHW